MKIILDAFFDNNFGDDFFISTILSRYPDAEFYVFWNRVHPAVLQRAADFGNLKILPANCMIIDEMRFDGYILIGGDVFLNWADFSRRITCMQSVKRQGGFVALQGFNLYEDYCEKTVEDLRTMMHLADVIVPRDRASVERLQKLVPDVEVVASTDMAFTARFDTPKTDNREILGIAPRKKYLIDEETHQRYCDGVAAVADGWLEKHPDGIVRFLAFSVGEFDDVAVSEEIIGRMQQGSRTEIAVHNGNLSAFMEQMRNCTAMLPTRFHGLVFALIYEIPFVAVTYEVKLNQLLDELNYSGLRLPYGEAFTPEQIAAAVAELDTWQVDAGALAAYYEKADRFFAALDRMVAAGREKEAEVPAGEFVCTALRDALNENAELKVKLEQLQMHYDYLKEDRDNVTHLYNDLLAKSKSFKGLAFLLAKRIVMLFKKSE